MKLLSARGVVACVAHCMIAVAAAEEDTGPLTLSAAVTTALDRNPDLKGATYALRAADARIAQAGLRPSPELTVEAENFAGSGELHAFDALETTLSLSQVIELGDKRRYRVDVARAERDGIAADRQAQQLDVLSEVTQRFIAVVEAQDELMLSQNVERLSTETLREIAARVEAARSPEAERSRAQIASIRARLDRQRTEQTLDVARRQLVALWGDAEAHFATAVADLHQLPPAEPMEQLLARLEDNPDLALLATESRLRTAELRLAQAQSRPSLEVGAGLRRLEAPDDIGLVAAFSLPLAVSGRNRDAIAEAQARVTQGDSQRAAGLLRARATLYALHHELSTARAEALALRAEVIPLAEQALAQIDEGFQRGRFSYLELGSAQRDLMDARHAAIEAAADAHRLHAEIERITAQPLGDAVNEGQP